MKIRVLFESPYYDSVWEFKESATVADFFDKIYQSLAQACDVGLRIEEPEFPQNIIDEFIEDGQPVPTQETKPVLWPRPPNSIDSFNLCQVRRIRRETFAKDLLQPSDDQFLFFDKYLVGFSLSDMGFQNEDTYIIMFADRLRGNLHTSPRVFTVPRRPEHIQVKRQCPFATWEAIEMILAMDGNVQTAIETLQSQYSVSRSNAARRREQAGGDAPPSAAPSLVRGKSVSEYTSLANITKVRAAVSWATQQQITDALRVAGGDVEAAIKSLSTGDPKVDELLAMFPHVSTADIQACLRRANGDVAMAASYLLDM